MFHTYLITISLTAVNPLIHITTPDVLIVLLLYHWYPPHYQSSKPHLTIFTTLNPQYPLKHVLFLYVPLFYPLFICPTPYYHPHILYPYFSYMSNYLYTAFPAFSYFSTFPLRCEIAKYHIILKHVLFPMF